MLKVRVIRATAIVFVLVLISIGLDPGTDGMEEYQKNIGSGTSMPEINRTVLEKALVDVHELKDDQHFKGNVTFNETNIDLDIYQLKLKDDWLIIDFYKEALMTLRATHKDENRLVLYGLNI